MGNLCSECFSFGGGEIVSQRSERVRLLTVEKDRLQRALQQQEEQERARLERVRQQQEAQERMRLERLHQEQQQQERARLERVRQQQAAQERMRLERQEEEARAQARVDQIATAMEQLVMDIDYCIRTAQGFNSVDPLAFECALRIIRRDADVQRSLQELAQWDIDSSLEDLIAEQNADFGMNQARTKVRVKHLTPFQGSPTHRVFGEFKCGHCRRKWSSAASWTDKWQKCKGCEAKCYPFFQHTLDRREDDSDDEEQERRPHDVMRCEKCIELGRICLPHMYVDSRYY